MALAVSKSLGIPLIEGLTTADDMPHPISFAVMYRERIDSFRELPKDKRPPRDLWNKPHRLDEYFDEVFSRNSSDTEKETIFIPIDEGEVE